MTAASTLLLTLALAVPADDPPTYKGHTAAEWANDLRHSKPEIREKALEALRELGPKAKDVVPEIVSAMEKWKDNGPFVMGGADAVAAIRGPRADVTRYALFALTVKCRQQLLPTSRYLLDHTPGVVTDLIELCGDKDAKVRAAAATFLGTLRDGRGKGEPPLIQKAGDAAKGVPAALEKLLADPERQVQYAAAAAISRIAPELGKKIIPVVIAGLRKADMALPVREAQLLSAVPDDAAAVLIPLLADPDPRARTAFLSALSHMPVVPHLSKALKDDPNPMIRAGAAAALSGRLAAEVVPALTDALKDRDADVRFAAARSLVNTDRKSAVPVGVLSDALKNAQGNRRTESAWLLSQLGAAAKPAVPVLKEMLADPTPAVRYQSALALAAVDPGDAAGAVPVLRAALPTESLLAARALGKIGPTAKDAVPDLVKLFTAAEPSYRVAAAVAAARIDPAQGEKATETIVGVMRAQKQRGSTVRMDTIRALRDIGPGAKTAVPVLLEQLAAEGPFRPDIAVAVLRIDPVAGKPAAEWLRKRLDEKSDEFDEAIFAVGELRAAGKPFVPELRGLLGSATHYVRAEAANALSGIGPDAADALPALRDALKTEKEKRTAQTIEAAIKAIEKK